jgi:hypothetical protein
VILRVVANGQRAITVVRSDVRITPSDTLPTTSRASEPSPRRPMKIASSSPSLAMQAISIAGSPVGV